MIKYLGSKRTLVPVLQRLAQIAAAGSALDLFTGTTRVAQAFKADGIEVIANDIASYSKVLADCYIATDASSLDLEQLTEVIADLNATPGIEGYFTETFCRRSRFFQPKNGRRIDAIRERLEKEFAFSPLRPVLLTALMEAADRVDSTTGVQMAYLKSWAPRAYNDLQLRLPQLLVGKGCALQSDANALLDRPDAPQTDLAYLDPPYNQHRYFANYHIWETLVRWDAPQTYGVAQKRIDTKDAATKSAFNRKREMPAALAEVIRNVKCKTLVLSYNNESWVSFEELYQAVAERVEQATALAFDSKRYVGAQIGIYNPAGRRVGQISHLRNLEYVFVGGEAEVIARVRDEFADCCVPAPLLV